MDISARLGSLALKDLHCPHCGSLNAEDELRCRRCGRRFVPPAQAEGPQDAATAARPHDEQPRPRQVALFDDRPKIIPFESIARTRTPSRSGPTAKRPDKGGEPTPPGRTSQQRLDLRAPAQRQQRSVNNDAPVATPKLRLKAAAFDALFVSIGLGLFAGVFAYAGGRFEFNSRTLMPYAGAVFSMIVFYEMFWCLLVRESAGMQCVRLRLLTFDGQRPSRSQFIGRFVVAWFSLAAAGIGLIWGLIDEETLTWHDHISKTFPTALNPTPGTFHRQ